MTEVGEVRDIALAEQRASFERGKDGAVSLAVAAGIADGELSIRFGEQIVKGRGRDVTHGRRLPSC